MNSYEATSSKGVERAVWTGRNRTGMANLLWLSTLYAHCIYVSNPKSTGLIKNNKVIIASSYIFTGGSKCSVGQECSAIQYDTNIIPRHMAT